MTRSRFAVALALPVAFVAGHVVGYGLGHPDHADRLVAEAGHEYLSSLSTAAVPLLVISLLLALLAGTGAKPFRPRVVPTALQFVGVYVGVELVEHLTRGWSFEHVATEPSLWLGIATQVVIAAAVVGGLRLFHRVGSKLAGAERELYQGRLLAVIPTPLLPAVSAVARTSVQPRGPPARPSFT